MYSFKELSQNLCDDPSPPVDADNDDEEQDHSLLDILSRRISKFKFPPPPRLSKSADNSYCSSSDSSTNSVAQQRSFYFPKKRHKFGSRATAPILPPLGIYWDIENCQVPKSKSATSIVKRLREVFLENYRESEFVVVCDVKKENSVIIQELHDAQVMVIHVSATSKNAADDKLRQSLRRFGELHPAPAGVVLISSDINFAADLSDLRYRRKIKVMLVHNVNVSNALILCADEHHDFMDLLKDLPENIPRSISPSFLTISNLPQDFDVRRLKTRLRKLIDNCGGKIIQIFTATGTATVRFGNYNAALRAQRRIQGEDVYGNKIKVVSSNIRNFSGHRVKNLDTSSYHQSQNCDVVGPPPGFSSLDLPSTSYSSQQSLFQNDKWRPQGSAASAATSTHLVQSSSSSTCSSPLDMWYHDPMQNNGARKQRTSQTTEHQQQQQTPQPVTSTLGSRVRQTSISSEVSDEQGRVFQIRDNDFRNTSQSNQQQPVELIISNLDSAIDVKELKKLLTNTIQQYVMIVSLNMIYADGAPVAKVRLQSQHEAQFIISQLHKQKLGSKRIVVSFAQTSNNLDQLKALVIATLQDVPYKSMPLFNFMNLLESRYQCTVSISELNRLNDVCKITDDGTRMIFLCQEMNTPSNSLNNTLVPYCTSHYQIGLKNKGWCELSFTQTPSIMISLDVFTDKLHTLLNLHMGCMPLLSFQACYEHEFQEPLPIDDNGVPLEHLISCVPKVEINYVGPNNTTKVVIFNAMLPEQAEEEDFTKPYPISLAMNLKVLCREIVDLLKTTDKCQLAVSKFIPAYHHYFGRQCRVADYGYTKLADLLESISHIVQIIGYGTRRVLTLSHATQKKRFLSDLLRILRVQPYKQISIQDFPQAYEKVMNKQFNVVEYGLCTIEDLLHTVPENSVVIQTNDENILMISIPKKEQTAEEMMHTKQFKVEVINLLEHSPYYTLPFDKFVPAYHHHFGQQCRLSDYGFTKLIELFEAISDIVKIGELSDGERTVSLTLPQALHVLGGQVVKIINSIPQSSILLNELPRLFLMEYGYPLKVQQFECDCIEELVAKLSDRIQIINSNAGLLLIEKRMDTLADTLIIRCWALLLKPPNCKNLKLFQYDYQVMYNSTFSIDSLRQIQDVVTLTSLDGTNFISLTPMYILAAHLYHIVYQEGGSVFYTELERLYYCKFGKKLSNYNINNISDFYTQFHLMFFCRASKKLSVVKLNRNLAEHMVPLPPALYQPNQSKINQGPLPRYMEYLKNKRKISPPKPDTPPTPDNPWNKNLTPSPPYKSSNFFVNIPIIPNPPILEETSDLISPVKGLIPPNTPWSLYQSPDPTELPMPDKFIGKNVVSDDSGDSGVNIRMENSPSDGNDESNNEDTRTREHFTSLDLLKD